MTARDGHLRDARLKKALDSAPDEAPVPAEWAHLAIKNAAQWSTHGAAPAPWWRRWWGGAAGARAPWNAAFATVLLAGFVTLFWHGQEVPEAQPDRAAQAPTGRATSAPDTVAKAEAPAAPPVVDDARSATGTAGERRIERERAAEAARAREARSVPAERRPMAAAPAAPPSPPPEPVFPQPAPVSPELAAAPPSPPAVAAAPAPMPAPVMADSPRRDSSTGAGPSVGFAAGSVARPAARATARDGALAEAQPAPQAAAKSAAEPVLLPPGVPADWTHARVAIDGRAAVGLPRARSGALHQRLQQLLAGFNAGASGTGAAPQGRGARIELLNAADERLAQLTVEGGALRWVVVTPGGDRATLGRADAAALEALLAELDRLTAAH